MIGRHCNKPLISLSENRLAFRKRCAVCARTFKQRKRQAVRAGDSR